MVPITIRSHFAELNYEAVGSLPWGYNITGLVIEYRDLDNGSYPVLTSGNIQINSTLISFESVTGPVANKYTITNIDVDGLAIGNYYLNLTII